MTDRRLPPNVNAVADRHGKIRYRYRRNGVKGGYLPGEAWSSEWLRVLSEFSALMPAERGSVESPRKPRPYSMDRLGAELRATIRWKRQAPDTQLVYGRMIDRLMETTNGRGQRFGDRDARQVNVASLERLLGKMADRPGAAKKMRDVLKRIFATAVKLSWRRDNPAALTDAIPQRGEGHHTWTDAEIEQFRSHYPYGTTARLVLELALNTAARRCNLATVERADIENGHIRVQHAKGGDETQVELMEETQRAIDALPSTPIRFLIVTAFGKPFSVAGLGNRMSEWAAKAGLPGCTLHGLRKARTRQLVEAGATNAEGRAVTGHKTDAMFNHYAKRANQPRLADRATAKLRGNLSNLGDK